MFRGLSKWGKSQILSLKSFWEHVSAFCVLSIVLNRIRVNFTIIESGREGGLRI